jgi:LacI family transcriptional regulator
MADRRESAAAREVSLRTMARRMNVAVSTVSRALAGDPRISAARVREARVLAERLGYRPKPLRRRRAGAIGLVIASERGGVGDDLHQQLVTLHVERAASPLKNHVHVEFIPRGGRATWPAVLSENRVDGVLLSGHPSVELCRRTVDCGIPAVTVNDLTLRTGTAAVITDFGPATAELLLRLIDLGHRRIGFVVSRREYPSVERRFLAYQETMRARALTIEPGMIVEGVEAGVAGGREAVRQYLERGPLPTAIIFTNDWMALGGLNELTRRGLHVPEDVSIAGYDDISVAREFAPALTTADGKVEVLAARAVELLQSQIEDGDNGADGPAQETLQAELLWRESCAEPRSRI